MTDKQREYQRIKYAKAKEIYEKFVALYPFQNEDLDNEIWKWIPSYENLYQGSTFGRVKSFQGKIPRIIKPLLTGHGYLQVGLHKGNKQILRTVHSIVAEIFIPRVANKTEINHIDGCKFNNHVFNLEWVTGSENIKAAYNAGLLKSGDERTDTHLTNEQVEWCRKVYIPRDAQFGAEALAKVIGVDARLLRLAIRGKTYKTAGGVFHEKAGVPENVRAKIRELYIKGSREFGTVALAKKFGYAQNTIWQIVNNQ